MLEIIKLQLANASEEVTDFVFDSAAKGASGALGKMAALIKASNVVDDATIEKMEATANLRIKELKESADEWADFGVPTDAKLDKAALKLAGDNVAIKGFEILEEVSDVALDVAMEKANGLHAKLAALIDASDHIPNSLKSDLDNAFVKLEELAQKVDDNIGIEMLPESLKQDDEEVVSVVGNASDVDTVA